MSDTKTVVALVGNPNCGKTTLFNELTGSNYDVGNRIGVTVESKKGICRYNKNMLIVDLPGIYSLSPNSAEEIIPIWTRGSKIVPTVWYPIREPDLSIS